MRSRIAVALALLLSVAVIAPALAGCSVTAGPTAKGPGMASTSPSYSTAGASSVNATGSMEMADMDCALCASKGNIPSVKGTTKIVNGVQVIQIGIKENAYNPNTFTAKTGIPIKVVFTGKASGCLAHPTFPKLNKSVDIGKSGAGTIDLGALPVGTYELTCGMASHGGQIIVK